MGDHCWGFCIVASQQKMNIFQVESGGEEWKCSNLGHTLKCGWFSYEDLHTANQEKASLETTGCARCGRSDSN